MGDKGCKYCDRPRRVGYPDRPAAYRALSCSRIDIPGCEELLSQASPYYLNSELCQKCYDLRTTRENDARSLFEEFGQSDTPREKLPGKLREKLQALKNEIDLKDAAERPVGQIAFDGCVSMVLLHRAVPDNKKTQK